VWRRSKMNSRHLELRVELETGFLSDHLEPRLAKAESVLEDRQAPKRGIKVRRRAKKTAQD